MGIEAAKQRIQRGRNEPRGRPIQVKGHTEIGRGGNIQAVHCKLCAGVIKGLIEGERPHWTERVKGTTIVYVPLVLAEFANYAEIKIRFDDGSGHITHICINCLKDLSLDDLETLYIGDMDQQMAEEAAGLGPVDWSLWDKRKPVSYEIIRKNGVSLET